jgi:putative transposase
LPRKHDNLVFDYQAFQIKNKVLVNDKPQVRTCGMGINQINAICYKQVAVLEKGLEISIPKSLHKKQITQIEIIPKFHSFHAVFVYEDEESKNIQISSNNKLLSIDLGLNNLATCVSNGVIKPFIIDGRRLKSINSYYNKRKAKLQSSLEKQHGKKWSNRLQKITDWRNTRVKDYIHKATAKVVNVCIENNISNVVVGDVTKSLDNISLGRKNNRNFVSLSLGQFINLLSYKLGQHNIELTVVNESYTSKSSFLDNDLLPKKYNSELKINYSGKRIKRGLYRSANGTQLNADVNGGYNILRKHDSNFCFKKLLETISDNVNSWLHPVKKILIN